MASFWAAGKRSDWSPDFNAKPLDAAVVGARSGPISEGATLFHDKACLNCHNIAGQGGRRGPDLTYVGDRLTKEEMILRIMNGGHNMPAFASTLGPEDLEKIVAFLQSRTAKQQSPD
ncbi:MAG: cytochrome c [Bryobacterales bacterium]